MWDGFLADSIDHRYDFS